MAKKKMTIEDLAVMIKRGFDQTASKEDLKATREELKDFKEEVDKRFAMMAHAIAQLAKAMDDGFRHVNARLDQIRHDISDLPAIRVGLRDLEARVERLERKAARS